MDFARSDHLSRKPTSIDDTVFAYQVDGTTPSAHTSKTVADYLEEYPGVTKLSAPEIAPSTFYECASRVAVRHEPGAQLTVTNLRTGTAATVRGNSIGYTLTPLLETFEEDDTLEVSQTLCDLGSALESETASAAPTSLDPIRVTPSEIYSGQELVSFNSIVNGATVEVAEQNVGPIGSLTSWPLPFYSNFDLTWGLGGPVQEGQVLEFTQTLCAGGESVTTQTSPVLAGCSSLGAPEIATPLAGDDFVLVTSAATGATVRVWDAQDNELGDSSGRANLQQVDGIFAIVDHPELRELDGLENVRSVSQLSIIGNSALRSLRGLSGLERVQGNVEIWGNPEVTQEEIDAFLSGVEVGGEVRLSP